MKIKKKIDEDINYLKLDIQYEDNCYKEILNIIYSEDLKIVSVRNEVGIIITYLLWLKSLIIMAYYREFIDIPKPLYHSYTQINMTRQIRSIPILNLV